MKEQAGARLLAEVGFVILAYDRPTTARLPIVVRGEEPRAVRQKDLDLTRKRRRSVMTGDGDERLSLAPTARRLSVVSMECRRERIHR
jgi:hypothetical protein